MLKCGFPCLHSPKFNGIIEVPIIKCVHNATTQNWRRRREEGRKRRRKLVVVVDKEQKIIPAPLSLTCLISVRSTLFWGGGGLQLHR